jgi:hypothetical protein
MKRISIDIPRNIRHHDSRLVDLAQVFMTYIWILVCLETNGRLKVEFLVKWIFMQIVRSF